MLFLHSFLERRYKKICGKLSHFWVVFCLCLKLTRIGADPFMQKLVLHIYVYANQTFFHKNGSGPVFFLKQGKRELIRSDKKDKNENRYTCSHKLNNNFVILLWFVLIFCSFIMIGLPLYCSRVWSKQGWLLRSYCDRTTIAKMNRQNV